MSKAVKNNKNIFVKKMSKTHRALTDLFKMFATKKLTKSGSRGIPFFRPKGVTNPSCPYGPFQNVRRKQKRWRYAEFNFFAQKCQQPTVPLRTFSKCSQKKAEKVVVPLCGNIFFSGVSRLASLATI